MKKGFTLIELLSVIIILGVIFIFIFPKLSSLINRGKEVNIEIIKNKLVESAMEYTEKYNPRLSNKLIDEGDNYVVSGKRLVDSGLIEQDDIDSIENFSRVKCTLDENEKVNCEIMYKPVKECTYEGELVQGAEFIDGQYTYHYKQYFDGSSWGNISSNAWGITLTDKTSTDPVTTKPCTKINGKPISDTRSAFMNSKATSIDLSGFDTSKVNNMSYMFYNSEATSLDLSNFDTSNVTNMAWMFYDSKATKINLGDFNTSKVSWIQSIFNNSKVKKLDVSTFNTSKAENMSYMFQNSSATEIILPEKWSTGKNADLTAMFTSTKVKELDLSGFDTSKAINMSSMFYNSSVSMIKGIGNLNTSNVTNMSSMFKDANVIELDLSKYDTSKVTNMTEMFSFCKKLKRLNVSNFNTTSVTSMNRTNGATYGGMFQECDSLTELDITSFDTSKITSMHHMFRGCDNLKAIYVSNKFVTDQVTIHDAMFTDSKKLVGGNGTTYSSSHVDKEYARVDASGTPGYFTAK
ncbi:MAG: BspA family leucine-rich repeat surface protein [Bacilli bacterium]|nr:BspA family leucine-rich repeat surface protein [Bacilli bacterium]